ncbi:MAG TPA: hypothetical protein DCF70_08980, partial [Treponema sp.]|nr:hypothetical protein [Treponema sp.]
TVLVQNPVAAYGSFLSSGEKSCIVGFGFEIEFTLNTESYIFENENKKLEAVSKNDGESRADCVAYENEQYDKETGVYRAKVRVLKAASDILIRPKCTLIENAEVTITQSEKGTKTISPADGTKVQSFLDRWYSVSFSPDEEYYEFIRWELYDINTGEEIPNETYVTLKDPTQPSTSYEVTKVPDTGIELALRPVVAERPQIISNTPQNSGILKDSSIQVLFDRDMDENSIYYSDDERKSLIAKVGEENLLSSDKREGKYYGYIKDGLTYYKNISLINKKTGENLNDKFKEPVFENASTLTIAASKEKGKIIDDYTQVLVTLEKDFFYSEKIDETTSKPVTLRGIVKWAYQVTNHGDEDALVFQKKNGNDVFTLKLYEQAQQSLAVGDKHPEIGNNGSGIKDLNFLKLKKKEDSIEGIEVGKTILYCDMALQDVTGGSGPNSTFTVCYERIKDYITDGSGTDGTDSFDVKYSTTTSEDAIFTGYLALDLPSDGTYRIWFDFTDRSQNHFYYPANANEKDSNVGFYVTQDTSINMTAPSVTDTSNEDGIKLKLNWTPCVDFAKTQIRYKKNTDTDWSDYKEFTTVTENEFKSLELNTEYSFEIVYTDFAGNTQTNKLYSKSADFNLSITGTPKMTAFLVGEDFDGSGLTMTVSLTTNSYSWTEDINQHDNFTSSEECLDGKKVTVSYEFKEVTKTVDIDATYYVAAANALTQKPVKLTETEYEGTLSGGTYYKFGDFPQTIASSQDDDDYTSDTVRNGWYLNKKDGYFYEKCAEDAFGSGYKYSDGKTDVAQLGANSTKYFKVEPIVWRALTTTFDHDADGTGDKILLLAESILTADMPYYDYSDVNRTIGGKTVYPNNYEHSKIRAYLNGLSYVVKAKDSAEQTTDSTYNGKGFLQTAFTSSAQALIADTIVGNSAESTTDAGNQHDQATSYACDDTKDKVFLLSVKEATTEAYGFKAYNVSASSRRRFPTDYAMANYAFSYYYSYNGSNNYGGDWWLRSPYYDNNYYYALQITYSGWGYSSNPVSYSKNGIVPALCISAQ